jgi:hypothetical protein
MGWSESKEDSFEASFYAFYDASDLKTSAPLAETEDCQHQARHEESQKNPPTKKKTGGAAPQEQAEERHQGWVNKEVADPALDTAEWDYEMMTGLSQKELMLTQSELEEERKLKERDDRRAADWSPATNPCLSRSPLLEAFAYR